jgi:hypothetical protein
VWAKANIPACKSKDVTQKKPEKTESIEKFAKNRVRTLSLVTIKLCATCTVHKSPKADAHQA